MGLLCERLVYKFTKLSTKLGLWELFICSHKFWFQKLGISSRRLNIEMGRFTTIPRKDWLCTKCKSNTIDNEIHFLTTCGKYDNQEKKYSSLVIKYSHFFCLRKLTKTILATVLKFEEREILDLVGHYY